jgi:multidrug resistance efflux pump
MAVVVPMVAQVAGPIVNLPLVDNQAVRTALAALEDG